MRRGGGIADGGEYFQTEIQQMISENSSTVSMLKNELQRKNEMLLSANEKIEKLSGSDKQLTEALKKEQNATELYAKAKAEHESAMALRSHFLSGHGI